VVWNVPEGTEKDVSMSDFVKLLLHEYMELDEGEEIETMRAHRTPLRPSGKMHESRAPFMCIY